MTNSDLLHDKSIVGSPTLHRISLAILLYAFWLLLSGNTEPKFLIYGILTAAIASWTCYPLLLVPNQDNSKKYFLFNINPFKLIYYFFWLMGQLILANIDVLKATVTPELKINPCVVKFRYTIDNPLGKVILANSITLTPGTVTLNMTKDGVYDIHALTNVASEGVQDYESMPSKVAWLLGQDYTYELLGVEE